MLAGVVILSLLKLGPLACDSEQIPYSKIDRQFSSVATADEDRPYPRYLVILKSSRVGSTFVKEVLTWLIIH